MNGLFRSSLALLALILPAVCPASPVEVSEVEFSFVEGAGGAGRWYEVAINLDVDRPDASQERNRRFVNNVWVQLGFALEVDVGSKRSFDFYFAETELVALEVGRHTVRFYLPPEIVERDGVRGEPHSFQVIASSDHDPEPHVVVSNNIEQATALQSFRARLAAARPETDGILVTQFDSPFRHSYPDETPSPRLRGAR